MTREKRRRGKKRTKNESKGANEEKESEKSNTKASSAPVERIHGVVTRRKNGTFGWYQRGSRHSRQSRVCPFVFGLP